MENMTGVVGLNVCQLPVASWGAMHSFAWTRGLTGARGELLESLRLVASIAVALVRSSQRVTISHECGNPS